MAAILHFHDKALSRSQLCFDFLNITDQVESRLLLLAIENQLVRFVTYANIADCVLKNKIKMTVKTHFGNKASAVSNSTNTVPLITNSVLFRRLDASFLVKMADMSMT